MQERKAGGFVWIGFRRGGQGPAQRQIQGRQGSGDELDGLLKAEWAPAIP